jgi:hypothetical protein
MMYGGTTDFLRAEVNGIPSDLSAGTRCSCGARGRSAKSPTTSSLSMAADIGVLK